MTDHKYGGKGLSDTAGQDKTLLGGVHSDDERPSLGQAAGGCLMSLGGLALGVVGLFLLTLTVGFIAMIVDPAPTQISRPVRVTIEPSITPHVPSASPPPSGASNTDEIDFLLTARSLAPSLESTPDDVLLSYGEYLCEMLSDGHSAESLKADALSMDLATVSEFDAILGSALVLFCPEHRP